jgi:hypothetical protein
MLPDDEPESSSDNLKRADFPVPSAGPIPDPQKTAEVLPILPPPVTPPAKASSGAPVAGRAGPKSAPEFDVLTPDPKPAAAKAAEPKTPAPKTGDASAPKDTIGQAKQLPQRSPQPSAAPSKPSKPAVPGTVDTSCCCVCEPCGEVCGYSGGVRDVSLGGLERVYASGEYLLWQIRSSAIPPLVTTGPPSSNGIIGNMGTVFLLGPGSIDQRAQSGGRFTVGYWLDDCRTFGIEASAFFLGDAARSFTFSSNQFPLLARPFFKLNAPAEEFAEISTSPGLATGTVSVNQTSRLWGAEADVRCRVCCGCDYRVDVFGGFRYLDLEEGLTISEVLQATPGGSTFGGDQIVVVDTFRTRNQFYGGQLGIDTEWDRGPWFVGFRGKIGLGVTHETIDIAGSQTITPPGGTPSVTPGGLLALSSNSGHHTNDRFAVVPEVELKVGYRLTDQLRVFVGYNFLYWSRVVRPGDQIDRGLDVNRIMNFLPPQPPVAEPRPAVPFKQSDFWAQGVSVGLEFRY